ncbi:hypothetical protein IU486_22320 [Streptomyces gardneri]|uniref:hypothetical protein n=1 Tax=Nocardia sputi TaxID=2943705 RepID=UPI001895D73E|nr:hypothetical protein [Nocardia sputi]MBF6167470.1 hypothetical protein [Streptomyces gardneri]
METPDLADLIWLFEDEPTRKYDDLDWPVGLHSFRLTRGGLAVLFSLDPLVGEAYISLYAGEEEIAYLGRLRQLDRLTIVRGPSGYEGLQLWFPSDTNEPLALQTKPQIRLSWNIRDVGTW